MTVRTLLDGWNRYTVGGGGIVRTAAGLRFICPPTETRRYTNAQIDDYQGLPRRAFRWRPPLTLTLRARFSHPTGVLRGTAGFGFWNDPFLMTGWRLPTLPQASWFFYTSQPSDLALATGVPGFGWKAATINAMGWRAVRGLFLAPFVAPVMRIQRARQWLWPFFQRAFHVAEAPITAEMTKWHNFVLDWGSNSVKFVINDSEVLCSRLGPAGPLGFVAWLDNQWMIVRPTGQIGYGTVSLAAPQWMEIAELRLANE